MKDYLDEYIVATRLIYRREGASIDELASALGKTPRAVYNIINQLDAIMFPIWDEQDPENPKKKRYHADKALAEYLPDLAFSEEDKAVYNYLVDGSENTPGMDVNARRFLTKIKLMAAERGFLLETGKRTTIPIVSARMVNKKIDSKETGRVTKALIDAIAKKQWVTLSYRNFRTGQTFTYHVYPVVLFVQNGDTYLSAINEHEQLRTLAIERILDVSSCDMTEAPKTSVDIDAFLGDPFGAFVDSDPFTVRLLLDDEQADYETEKNWPECVSFDKTEEGTVMTAKTGCAFHCMRWILERTPHVIVLEPEWLKEKAIEALREGLEMNGVRDV